MIRRLAWLETKVLVRDPFTLVFSLGLPLLALSAIGAVLGNEAVAGRYFGAGAVDYYVPAYVVMVIAALGLVSVPRHVASYRERGVLRRYQTAGMSPWTLLAAFGLSAAGLAAAASAGFTLLVGPAFGLSPPDAPLLLLAGFGLAAAGFAAVGVTLGVMLPSSRVAELVGVGLWLILLVIGGASVPREELAASLQRVQDATPVWHAVQALQDAWFGVDAGASWAALLVLLLVGVATASLTFRLE